MLAKFYQSQEINPEDLEEENLEMQDLEGPVDMEDDDVAMEPSSGAKRDFLSDLFPFTRPVAFYKGLMEDVGRMQGVGYIIGCTTTAHPALPLACRLMGSDCMMLLDRPAEHSLNHGQVICEEYLLKKALADLPISPVKRRLEVSEVQFIDGGRLDDANQTTQWFSISADAADKFSGINEWPGNLRDESVPLLQQQLEKYNLAIADFPGRGKGLITLKPLREGAHWHFQQHFFRQSLQV